MVPSGVRSGRTVVDLQDCGIASIDRKNASNSSLVRHDGSSAAARREDPLGGGLPSWAVYTPTTNGMTGMDKRLGTFPFRSVP
jgi:hypothetical protein